MRTLVTMKSATATLLGLAAFAAARPTVYLIRHGEKPDRGNELSAQGQQRAQCLRSVFGPGSGYNIGHIMAQTPQSGEPGLAKVPKARRSRH